MEKIEIRSLEALGMFLGRIYWMELEMETLIQWDVYVRTIEPELTNVLLRLSHDSISHKEKVKELASNLGDFDLDALSKMLKAVTFDFSNMQVVEMFGEILKYEILAQDLYKKLKSSVPKDFVAEIWKGDDPVDFYRTLNMLVKAEQEHIDLVKPYAGRISRIH